MDIVLLLKNVKKPENEEWISKHSSMTCQKVNSSGILLHSPDDSTLSETDHYAFRLKKETLNEDNKDKGEIAADTFDDFTQSLDIDMENCNLPSLSYNKDGKVKKKTEKNHSRKSITLPVQVLLYLNTMNFCY
ncbi:ankyrin repeat domain-containing protein 26-like isoform X2 [Antechinus flavipes]|uniref:ankyrin repeat domain-containing protein 26-like isoform X2 n=1 Tax=Antechinus flavipes TaxID=38775 RepID=UPI00223695FA|nr:ankyrin repeat domain-containing protein 26-like isoform X2 [Antechinus flavipes]XP_051856245.1 ankyrin repeat domain-containing protein 26-like isoform X2 [Antechinus flavipes]